MTPIGYAKTDQAIIKENATRQIQEAAAQAFYTDSANVEVRLADKRLVLPDCGQPFDVGFPFSDRATAQLDCVSPKWRGFIQIRLKEGVTDGSVQALGEAGCGKNLTSLTLESECLFVLLSLVFFL